MGPKSGEQGKSTRVNFKRDLQEVECFNCHSKGHYSFNPFTGNFTGTIIQFSY